jgi:hypothetical protein
VNVAHDQDRKIVLSHLTDANRAPEVKP